MRNTQPAIKLGNHNAVKKLSPDQAVLQQGYNSDAMRVANLTASRMIMGNVVIENDGQIILKQSFTVG